MSGSFGHMKLFCVWNIVIMLRYIIILYCSAILQTTTSSSESRADSRQLKLFEEPISYDVESTVLLNELERKEKEVSYKVKAKLNVIPLWTEAGVQSVLKFEVCLLDIYKKSIFMSFMKRKEKKNCLELFDKDFIRNFSI